MRLYSSGGRRLAKGASPRRGGKRLQRGRLRIRLLAIPLLLLCAALLTSGFLPGRGGAPVAQALQPQTSTEQTELLPSQPTSEDSAPVDQSVQREDGTFLLSFAGDCTLGAEYAGWNKSGNFPSVVGDNYAYPFSNVRDLFTQDDFTFVNLECALTDHNVPAEKEYRFRGLPAYGQILTEGGIEAVTLANNHSLDYGTTGLADTRQVLSDLDIAAGGDKETFLCTTERGLTIGVYTAYHIGKTEVRNAMESLRQQGAQVLIAAFHMGTEGSYTPTAWQQEMCRYAADCGAHIVYNSHPHVLQPIERRNGSVILYSMGNFCFGGNRNPTDKDTAVVQVTVQLNDDGIAEVAEVSAIPCSVSSRSDRNDYCPTPYAPDSKAYIRVESKLNGTYRAPVKQATDSAPASGSTAGTSSSTADTPAENSTEQQPAVSQPESGLTDQGTAPGITVAVLDSVPA